MTLFFQILAIFSFVSLTIIDFFSKNWDGFGLNFSLVLLYVFLYLRPFSIIVK